MKNKEVRSMMPRSPQYSFRRSGRLKLFHCSDIPTDGTKATLGKAASTLAQTKAEAAN